jgi:hypothetical protein
MKIKKLTLISILILFMVSCEEDKIDLTGLEDYFFEHVDYVYNADHTYRQIDTIVYSFEYPDSVRAIDRMYPLSEEGIYEYEGTNIVKKTFVIVENKVYFIAQSDVFYSGIPLFESFWEIISINGEYLNIKEMGVVNHRLKCIKK